MIQMKEDALVELAAQSAHFPHPELDIEKAADLIAQVNPSFDRESFCKRARVAFYRRYGTTYLNDTIPY